MVMVVHQSGYYIVCCPNEPVVNVLSLGTYTLLPYLCWGSTYFPLVLSDLMDSYSDQNRYSHAQRPCPPTDVHTEVGNPSQKSGSDDKQHLWGPHLGDCQYHPYMNVRLQY